MAYAVHAKYKLIVAANRDEFFLRPTAAAEFWQEQPGLLAGRDLQQGGTWMGITRSRRFAALTNVRDPHAMGSDVMSRGLIVAQYLLGEDAPNKFLDDLQVRTHAYNGFNLLAGDADNLYFFNSASAQLTPLQPGIYGLSNDTLDTPWPKVARAKSAMEKALSNDEQNLEGELFELLADRALAADHSLPDTGIGLEKERWLSAVFINAENYGTRSSTVLLAGTAESLFVERSFNNTGVATQTRRFVF
jgi:uncharacterized protein with NRDE domain